MRIGLSIVAVLTAVTALSQGKPAFAGVFLGDLSVAPIEPSNKQNGAQPRIKATTAAAPTLGPEIASKKKKKSSSVTPNEPR